MRSFFNNAVAAIALTMLAVTSAQAFTLHQGESVTLNADFTGANPPPPYLGAVILQFVFSGTDPGETFAADLFGGLNATGYIDTINNVIGMFGNITSFLPDMLDGVYSIRLTATAGDFNVDDVWFEARNSIFGGPADVAIPAAIVAVSEPTSLALFGAIAGIAALRRRRIFG